MSRCTSTTEADRAAMLDAICGKLGFELLGACEFESPRGTS
jgi:hypothetical protein